MPIVDGDIRPLIAVDFDQTLCDSRYPKCGPIKDGAKEAMIALREMGFLLLIYSCRTCSWHFNIFGGSADDSVMGRDHVIAMKEWLDEREIPYDEIDDGSKGKPMADFYIDDKGVRFENNWPEIVKFIKSRTYAHN
jgi:hypothetical protein